MKPQELGLAQGSRERAHLRVPGQAPQELAHHLVLEPAQGSRERANLRVLGLAKGSRERVNLRVLGPAQGPQESELVQVKRPQVRVPWEQVREQRELECHREQEPGHLRVLGQARVKWGVKLEPAQLVLRAQVPQLSQAGQLERQGRPPAVREALAVLEVVPRSY